jgi:hypothetical protein
MVLKMLVWICVDTEEHVNQYYEWQQGNMSVRGWVWELTEKTESTEQTFVWLHQQECNLKEISKMAK